MIPEGAYAQVFITLALYNCDEHISCCILDLFLLEGEKALVRLVINSIIMN